MLIKILVLLLASRASLCGPVKSHERIIGGERAQEGEIPWQISILTSGGGLLCGGTIINSEWIVTTAECSDDYITPYEYRVRAGSLYYNFGGTLHNISQIIIHELYDDYTQENDIALWKVTPPFVWDNVTSPVGIPAQGTEILPDTMVSISGWGHTSFPNGFESAYLMKASLPIVSKEVCDEAYASYTDIFPSMICAGYPDGDTETCNKDTGGPLYLDGVVYGITSMGFCGWRGIPGIYTEVSVFHDWIIANAVSIQK